MKYRFLLAFIFILLAVEASHAAALSGLFLGGGFFSGFAGQLLKLAIGVGFSYLAQRLGNRPQAAQRINPRQVSYGDSVPLQGVFGRQLVAGHCVHKNEFDDAKRLQEVRVLADMWCDGLDGIYVDGRQRALLPVAGPYTNNEVARFHVEGYGALIDVRFHDGRPGQLADTEIITHTPGWDADRKYTGKCYVALTMISDKEKFNGFPDFAFILRGARVYDPRKDGSIGGAGAHRFDDPATWEFSANPAVQAYHYCRGFFLNGKRVLGAGFSAADLNFDSFITVMNVCDQQVQRPEGTWRNRYESHLTWDEENKHYEVLDILCEAMGGKRGERQGQVAVFAGTVQAPVLTITDDDLALGESVVFSPKRAGTFLYNGLQGVYTHPTEFTPTPYPLFQPSIFKDADGQSRIEAFNLESVQDGHQAFLLVKQRLFFDRLEATAKITVDLKELQLEAFDWIVWQSADPLIGTKTWRVEEVDTDFFGGKITLSLTQIDVAVYDDNATAADVAEPVRERPFSGYQKEVFGFGVSAIALEGADGSRVPALKFNYNPITDPAIRAVKFEYRVVGDTEVLKAVDNSVGDGSYYSSDGVMPGYTYEARARLDSMPGRETVWTNWVPIAVPTGPILVPLQQGQVDHSHLAKDLGNEVGILNGTGAGSLSAIIDHLKDEIERVAVVSIGENVNSHVQREKLSASVKTAVAQITSELLVLASDGDALAQRVDTVEAGVGDNEAAIISEAQARASEDNALATLLTVLSAEIDDAAAAVVSEATTRASEDDVLAQQIIDTAASMGTAYAQSLFKVDAAVDGGGASATMTLKVRAGTGNDFVDSGLRLIANSNGTSQVVVVANQFIVIKPGGSSAPLFNAGGEIDGVFIPQITSDKINVTKLSAVSANLGLITALDGIIVGNSRFESDGTFVVSD